ncbi:MAG TPA: hypothetical protein VHD87_12910 [Acidimicrobiales bacterium]|nr:hypothetical protein [Acidimicrobiales bacterium]
MVAHRLLTRATLAAIAALSAVVAAPATAAAGSSSPSDMLSYKEAKLGSGYFPRRGPEFPGDDRVRFRKLRRDIVDYIRAVRAHNPHRAARIAWQLPGFPYATCVWATARGDTLAAADERLRVAEADAAGYARQLGVTWKPPKSALTDDTIRFAREEAQRRFCPDGRRRAEVFAVLPHASRRHPFGRPSQEVPINDTVVPGDILTANTEDYDILTADVAFAYWDAATLPSSTTKWWPETVAEFLCYPESQGVVFFKTHEEIDAYYADLRTKQLEIWDDSTDRRGKLNVVRRWMIDRFENHEVLRKICPQGPKIPAY